MPLLSRRSFVVALSGAVLAGGVAVVPLSANQAHRAMEVFLSPTCGCCKAWVSHIEKAGFSVRVTEISDLASRKRTAGVPDQLRSCHTGIIEGYFIEGHVPAQDIIRLLIERPLALGLSVPDMPIGSPGMEVDGAKPDAFDTVLVLAGGKTLIWAKHAG